MLKFSFVILSKFSKFFKESLSLLPNKKNLKNLKKLVNASTPSLLLLKVKFIYKKGLTI